MTQDKREFSEPRAITEASISIAGGTKYLRLLEPGSEDKPELWDDFLKTIYRLCMRMEMLRDNADEWAQDTVIVVLKKLPDLRERGINPWNYAWGILRNYIRSAIRERQERRRDLRLAETYSLESGSNEAAHEQFTQLRTTNTPEKIFESSEHERFEEVHTQSLEDCTRAALLALPHVRRDLFGEYYALKTHDAEKRRALVEDYDLKTYNNLQVTIHRTWQKLYSSIGDCMNQEGGFPTDWSTTKHGQELIRNYVKKKICS